MRVEEGFTKADDVLDRIRAEIVDFEEELFHRPNTDYADYAAVRYCVEIIDKYKLEEPKVENIKKLTNKEWIDFLSKQFEISRTSAKEMLHVMMSVKKEDNFKKQFSGRK